MATSGSNRTPPTRLLIGGAWVDGESTATVRDKYTGAALAELAQASRAQVAEAVRLAQAAFERGAPPPYERYEILMRAADGLAARREAFLETIVAESGFTRSDATTEINRGQQTLRQSAEEAKRLSGEMVPLAGAPGQHHRLAFTVRVPLGVVCAITPFNSPLNTVLHKVAPALAAGDAVVLKPASYTPLTSALLCEVLLEAGVPDGLLSLLHGPGGALGAWLGEEDAIRFFTFTGSTETGRRIQAAAGLRRTQMELGSISATLINADADLDRALPRVTAASFRKAGQVCTSIQRLYVHRAVFETFQARFLDATARLKVGDPHEEGTFVGPMIDEREAERALSWVEEAVEGGARLLAGGTREGALVQPTVLADVSHDMRVMQAEIFAPVVCLIPFDDLNAAIDDVNATPYGLATGLFTNDLAAAFAAAQRLKVGGVHINETSSSRVDLMPYGGCKASGFGREGPRYAIQELTEERLVTISP